MFAGSDQVSDAETTRATAGQRDQDDQDQDGAVGDTFAEADMEDEPDLGWAPQGGNKSRLRALLQWAHQKMGHPNQEKILRILKLGGASDLSIRSGTIAASTCGPD